MKRFKHFIRCSLSICCVLFASCGNDEEPGNGGQYPVVFATAIDGLVNTRATVDNIWNGGEQVQVSIDGAAASTFTAAANGKLTANVPVFWQTGQSITVRAWYPSGWDMQADQSAQSAYQAADFIFAPEKAITYAERNTASLEFSHKTAKVTATLTAGVNIANLADATVSFYGYTEGTANTGNGTLLGGNNGWIMSRKKENGVFTALLIPQNMTGLKFIRVSFWLIDYYYTPAGDEADLKAGRSYTYYITLNTTGLTVTSNIIPWDNSTESGIADVPVP